MNPFPPTYRSMRAFITTLSTPKIDRLMRRVMLGALIADLIILPASFIKLSSSLKIIPVMAATHAVSGEVLVGPATTLFMQQLKDNNFVPVVFKKIIRRPFTGDGSLITLNGDNVQVFEYSDNDTAMKDASLLADKYAVGSQKLVWKKNMHVYINDKLVIFYFGSQSPITTLLDQNAVAFLTPPAKPSPALSVK